MGFSVPWWRWAMPVKSLFTLGELGALRVIQHGIDLALDARHVLYAITCDLRSLVLQLGYLPGVVSAARVEGDQASAQLHLFAAQGAGFLAVVLHDLVNLQPLVVAQAEALEFGHGATAIKATVWTALGKDKRGSRKPCSGNCREREFL